MEYASGRSRYHLAKRGIKELDLSRRAGTGVATKKKILFIHNSICTFQRVISVVNQSPEHDGV